MRWRFRIFDLTRVTPVLCREVFANQLTGTIPNGISSLTNLEYLSVIVIVVVSMVLYAGGSKWCLGSRLWMCERVLVVVVCVCVSSGGVATMCGIRGGSIGDVELFVSSAAGGGESMHPIYKLVS